MMDAWLAFAHGKDPAASGIGPWPLYDAGTRATMLFGTQTSGIAHDPFGEERAALETLL